MKKIIASCVAVGGFLVGIVAHAQTGIGSILPIATTTLKADLSSSPLSLFQDLYGVILLVVGIPFAFWFINMVIGFVRRHTRTAGRRS
jgi:hypothetical protein